jgi:hypothetical protein
MVLAAAWSGGGGSVLGGHTIGGWRRGTQHDGGRLRAVSARSRETGEAEVLTGGPGALCWVLNRFKPSKSIQTCSNLFQIISNLIHSKKDLPKLKKFEIKYEFEVFVERNNFLYRNFFRFEMSFELKYGEVKVCF